MAFTIASFSPNGAQSKAGNAPQTWTYSTTDAYTAVAASGYFNEVASLLKVGDVIWNYDSDAPTMYVHVVLTNASDVVDVSAGTAISVA
jgi:hypothetical protein|tara:strand:+ start:264 stop:530 length:267 start_codon:yes stop_codon:yes gene_type:complete